MSEGPFGVARLWRHYGQKIRRYLGVTVVNVLIGQTILLFFQVVLDWPGVAANVAAVTISTVPAYLLSRAYVWQKQGAHSMSAEIAPFWAMAFVGLLLSTLFVAIVESVSDTTLGVQIANAAAFGLLWIVKFFVLERIMWSGDVEAGAPQTESAHP